MTFQFCTCLQIFTAARGKILKFLWNRIRFNITLRACNDSWREPCAHAMIQSFHKAFLNCKRMQLHSLFRCVTVYQTRRRDCLFWSNKVDSRMEKKPHLSIQGDFKEQDIHMFKHGPFSLHQQIFLFFSAWCVALWRRMTLWERRARLVLLLVRRPIFI